MDQKKYSRDVDTLIALVSYLAMTKYKSMRPSKLAERLSLEKDEVQSVLDKYKAIFRKSRHISEQNGENYYTLHLRYALRWLDDEREDPTEPKLPPEYLTTLYSFLSNRVVQEETYDRERIKNIVTMVAACVAAITGLITAFLK